MASFERIVEWLSRFFDWIARGAVFAMLLIVVGNILGRQFWKPIFGTFDFVGFLGAIIVAFSLAYCAFLKGHIEVEMVMARFSERVQGIVGVFIGLLSLGMFLVVAWQCIVFANEIWRAGEVSMTALIAFHPYIYIIAFGCLLMCLVIILNISKSIAKAVKK